MATPAPLIEISGPPGARGEAHGEAARDRIRRGIAHYRERLSEVRLDAEGLRDLVGGFLPCIERFDPGFVPEMRGIAAGAAVPFEHIVMLNCRTEILKLAASGARGVHAGAEGECTGLVATGAATADGRLIHAQNWDWMAECAETAVVLRIRRDDGPDILTFTEAGALARSGFNAAGVAMTANYLQCDRDYRQAGVPLALIRRKALSQESLALAMRAVYATPKSASNNMIVSHPAGVVIDFECAPDETFQVHPEAGLLVHANHWISPAALAKLRETGVEATPDSLYRDLRLRDLLAPLRGRITREAVKAALLDDFQSPWSVCRPPRPSLGGTMTATVASIVMVPEQGLMEVAMLPAHDPTFSTYRLAMDERAFDGVPAERAAARRSVA